MPRGKVKGTGSAGGTDRRCGMSGRRFSTEGKGEGASLGGAFSRQTRQADGECPGEALREQQPEGREPEGPEVAPQRRL